MRRDRRRTFRVELNSAATIYDVDRHLERPCIVSDFSNGGAKISGIRTRTIPDEFKLRISHSQDRARACRVIWRTDDTLGVEFIDNERKPKAKAARKKIPQPIPRCRG